MGKLITKGVYVDWVFINSHIILIIMYADHDSVVMQLHGHKYREAAPMLRLQPQLRRQPPSPSREARARVGARVEGLEASLAAAPAPFSRQHQPSLSPT